MLRVLCLVGVLAGCDGIFDVDKVGDQSPPDAPGPDAPIPAGLVAWFEMESLSSGTAIDTAGNHDGGCVGSSCPTVVPGKVGNGFAFDGTSTVIHAPSGGDLDVASDLTVALWVRADSAPTGNDYVCVFNKIYGTGTEDSWQFCMGGATSSWLVFLRSTQIPGPVIDVGVWEHLAFTWSKSNDQLFEYVNGALYGQYLATTLFDSGGVRIGADSDSGADLWFLNGALDDLRIYQRVLSSTEIMDLTRLKAQ